MGARSPAGTCWQPRQRWCLSPRRTQEALKSGHFVGVLRLLLRLQRICNHPGLVAPRLPESSYSAGPLRCRSAALILKALDGDFWKVRRGCAGLCLGAVPRASGTAVSANLRPAFRDRLMLGLPLDLEAAWQWAPRTEPTV